MKIQCSWCEKKIGDRVVITPAMQAICLVCNADQSMYFPRQCTYKGFNDKGLHIFVFDEVLVCPGCGNRSEGSQADCFKDGGIIDFSAVMQKKEINL